jgi:large subunit ribosomal protein L25
MELSVQPRTILGKKVRTLRKEGLIPAELYGHGIKNVHISVPAKEFNKMFREAGTTTVVTLHVGTEKHPVMVHEVLRDRILNDIVHIDFHEVRMDEKIRAHVPVEFVGESPAVKEFAAIINKAIAEIEVEAFPQDIPHSFIVDLAALDVIDKSIYVKDLVVPKGVELQIDAEMAIATATPPKAVEEVVAEETAVDVTAIKSEAEEKKAERDASKAAPTEAE